MALVLLALLVIGMVIKFWYLLVAAGVVWLLALVVKGWWAAGADRRRHAHAMREITALHHAALRRMQEVVERHVIDGQAEEE